jgi:hypothetical protein
MKNVWSSNVFSPQSAMGEKAAGWPVDAWGRALLGKIAAAMSDED